MDEVPSKTQSADMVASSVDSGHEEKWSTAEEGHLQEEHDESFNPGLAVFYVAIPKLLTAARRS